MSQEEQKKITQKRWLSLAASCLINLCIGALYAWSVFAGPMAVYLSDVLGREMTAADLAIVFSVGNSFGFITMIGGGFLNQKIGPKWVIFAGGILFGLGFLICGFAQSVGMLVVGYGLFSGLAMGLAYGCTISNSVKLFPDKAGLVGGIATAAYGISSVIIPPIANACIGTMGVSKAFMVFGIVIVVIVGVASQFIIACPNGFVPYGWTPKTPEKKSETSSVEDKNWQQMLKTPAAYVMMIMLFFGAVLGMMVISQASSIAQSMIGMTAAQAAIVVSVLALFNTAGRIVAGMISDRIGCINTLSGVFVLSIIGIGILFVSSSTVPFYIGICIVGVCFGSLMGVYPSFTSEVFGRKYSSVNYGIMFIGFNMAGLVGPMIISSIFNKTGSFRNAFVVAFVFALIGLACSFVYRVMKKK